MGVPPAYHARRQSVYCPSASRLFFNARKRSKGIKKAQGYLRLIAN